jgi:3-oxoacyl-[acyl-carrier protein] reductase
MSERVLITGGAGGIGVAIAARAIEEGYEPVVIDRVGSDIIADLSDPVETAEALQEALRGGPITRLVNNVGMIKVSRLEDLTLDELDMTWAVNTRTAVQCAQAVLPSMKDASFGRIVNISSRAALGKEGRSAYAASKAALMGLTRTWALELGAHGVTVNTLGPGPIRTPMFEAANPSGQPATEAIINGIPMKRMGEPEDIANSVAHFLDARTGFVTGQTLFVCGGKSVGQVGM